MEDERADDAAAAALDPTTADPRELMRLLLPAARREYARAWEWLADATIPLARRRLGRERARAIAADHDVVAAALRDRQVSLADDDLLNVRHLADELERHAAALARIASISPHGLVSTKELRPESLGCGTRYRDPSRSAAPAGTRGAAPRPRRDDRQGRGRGGHGGGDARGRP